MLRFSFGFGNNTKLLFKFFGLTGGIVWHLLPTIMVGSLYARKYEALKKVPVKDYFLQINFLCFTIIDIFVIRRQKDEEDQSPQEDTSQIISPPLNRKMRRKFKTK